jgi:hypothetical protein
MAIYGVCLSGPPIIRNQVVKIDFPNQGRVTNDSLVEGIVLGDDSRFVIRMRDLLIYHTDLNACNFDERFFEHRLSTAERSSFLNTSQFNLRLNFGNRPLDSIATITMHRSSRNTINPSDSNADYSYNSPDEEPSTESNKIISNNLKLLVDPRGFELTTKNLLNVFKYIPVSISSVTHGWYDHDNQRIVYYEPVKVDPNTMRYPWRNRCGKSLEIKTKEVHENYVPGLLSVFKLRNCSFIVKNYIDSGKLFKFTNEKKEAVGKQFEALEIHLGSTIKNSTEPVNTIILKLPTGNRRFVLSDVQIIYPNVKGFNESKDRTIKVGQNIKVIDDKHTIFKKNDIVKASDIVRIGQKQYLVFKRPDEKEKVYNIKKFKVI